MDPTPAGNKKRHGGPTTIHSLEHDILCIVFSFLDLFDLVRSSAVCKSWNAIINKSKLLQVFYLKQRRKMGFVGYSESSEKSLNVYLEEMAMERHRLALREGEIGVDQWKGHSLGVKQCRMKMGLLLTGVGDKVMRLWSLENYNCVEEYSTPDTASLVDFDFDESKIVGLLGTRLCIWRRSGTKSMFPSREGTFAKGLCMRYFDPEAVVGCEDGTARVFDMYSKSCSRIIRMHDGPLSCLDLRDDQLIISGSSLGSVSISGLLSDQRIAKLRSRNSTDLRALSFNPCSHLVFAGSTSGYTTCWDLRTMRILWDKRVSPNVIYSLQHLGNDRSTLVVGGIDGVVRLINQNTGEILSSIVLEGKMLSGSRGNYGVVERAKGRRLAEDTHIDSIPRSDRPPITCLAVGMKKIVTTHNSKYIRMWKFRN
ncbi:F-box/WD-40 repeat-containing protein [Morus notabilis]|uniref:F-box/WD-40 repeat-containing protein n=1 Tax=Morus notabilis TaxID=981085 RepID=W9S9S2_9ROSA|nr:F-box/WD-40 repeat-containing protein At3g52030 [Morus notabilis]EXB95302.1 F-box/WD-40 repeat-containing protein [Morus notabilis]